MSAALAGDGLDKATEDKSEIVSSINPMLQVPELVHKSHHQPRQMLTHKALVRNVSMLLRKPGRFPFGVTRL